MFLGHYLSGFRDSRALRIDDYADFTIKQVVVTADKIVGFMLERLSCSRYIDLLLSAELNLICRHWLLNFLLYSLSATPHCPSRLPIIAN